jgi:flagellar hook-length control protein FliK
MLAKAVNGNQQMTVRLHPVELGMVQVRIERMSSGSTLVEITAEKIDALHAMQRDQTRLHRSLDEAGIPEAGRTITFHAVPPTQASSGTSGSGQGIGQHAAAGRTNNSDPDTRNSADGNRRGYPARETKPWSGGKRPAGSSVPSDVSSAVDPIPYRIGLDITA